MNATGFSRPRLIVSGDGRGVVGRTGSRLLADLAEVTGLESGFVDALAPTRQRSGGHAPGRVAVDLAVLLADGGEAISDLAVLREQPEVFGPVASDPTAWRVLNSIDAAGIARLRGARAVARELAWAQHAETRGTFPQAKAAGRVIPGLVVDIDATIVLCHSEKENATPTWKRTFGYHPLLCFLDNTGEALAGILRPGRAGSNTAADHVEALDLALAQLPDEHRHGTPVLVRADTAGCTHAFLAHIRTLREQGVDVRFSVGAPVDEQIRAAITALPASAWYPAIEADGQVRDGAEVAELTGLLYGYGTHLPAGTRFLVRRERPHPGAQLSLFDTIEGYRHQVIATDTPPSHGPLTWIEARHRAHARVEDRIRCGKDSGFGRFPSRDYAINQAWLELALTGIDLTAWMRMLLLDGALARAEPKKLRYRLLHVAARITRSARQTTLHIASTWPWASQLAAAFATLAQLPRPVTS
ncbi:IS1380 family transposase [Actinospica sp. MGRD01-02]|uniref:IS1380 family transposase n=1 Tax=Actinospica acidithermotolerans TaxID=2828514 RepID=A0A941ECA1_9ACTN|nr:IS1380 family transposase [Actinospica acidithermotolerans]MBR7826389.1 IS1380 family transposase [Actinospica acidithermotolerans]